MKIETIKTTHLNGLLEQNSYILTDNNTCILIDAGAKVEDILNVVNNKKIDAIFITHCHYDHIWNVENYEKFFNCKIFLSKESDKFLNNPKYNLSPMFGEEKSYFIKNKCTLKDGEKIQINDITVTSIQTPGHTDDSMCFLINNEILFTGDTVFSNSIGNTSFPTGSEKKLYNSLKKLINLDYTTAYPGHMDFVPKFEMNKNILYFINYLENLYS